MHDHLQRAVSYAGLAVEEEPKISIFQADEDTVLDRNMLAQNGAAVNGKKSQHTPTSPPHKVKKKELQKKTDDSHVTQICEWVARHQIGLSVNLLALLALTHLCFPRARRHTRKFTELSYYNPETTEYTIGWNDACLVFHWIVLFSGLRAAVIDYVLTPLAQWGGIKKKKDLTRFSEQAWLLIYYTFFIPIGLYVMYNSDYWLNMKMMWRNWPNREIGGALKWYILVQFAFWLQQIVVVHIEERRKDYAQMFTHHIITCLLLFCSYGYHQTKVGNVILVLMDVVDLFLPLAKCLKYLGFGSICDVIFGIFMVTWVIARHILYLAVCWSVFHDIPNEINYGCYSGSKQDLKGPFEAPDNWSHLLEPFRDPKGVVCFNGTIKWGFLSALLFLQGLTLMWFWLICKVAVKVLKGGKADDVRSDDEEEEEEIEEDSQPKPEHVESLLTEEVGVEGINLKGRSNSNKRVRGKKSISGSNGVASGVSLDGAGPRKELLGRIGCDKGL